MSRVGRSAPARIGHPTRGRLTWRRSPGGSSGGRGTPAPHLVAAAADDHLLSPAGALAQLLVFGAVVVVLLAITGLNVYTRYVRFRQSPELLAATAEQMRQRLGYNDAPADTVHGFTTRTDYLTWQRARTAGPHHWEHLQSLRPQLVLFWYAAAHGLS